MEGFLLVCVFVLLVLIFHYRSKQKDERAEDRKLVRDLTTRIFFLEETVTKLKREPETIKPAADAAVEAKPAPKPRVEPTPQETASAWVKATPPQAPLKTPAIAAPPKPIETPAMPVAQKPAPPMVSVPVRVPVSSVPPPRFETAHKEPAVPLKDQFKSWLDIIEEKLGRNWLGKIGISLIVLGAAAYMATKIPQLPPLGKVLVGLAVDAVLLGGGIWLERKQKYRILARTGVGGGWAFLFFLSWAIYNLDATQIITSAPLDFLIMLIVAVAMVWHTLHYRSQTVTGLAYLLAFVTVGLNHDNVPFIGGLGAGILLAVGLVFIINRFQWYELELFGIAASYLNHFFWLQPIIEPMNGANHPFPEFLSSASVLILYWAIFRASYVWRKVSSQYQERISTASALLNPALLLAMLKYQSVHKEWASWGLLAIGAVETALGQLPITRRRRTAVIVLSTLGVVLLVAAFPFRFSGTNLSVLWLVEAEALLLIGVWTQEIVFRRLGLLAALLVSGHMVAVDAYSVYFVRVANIGTSEYALAVFFLVASIVFYGNAHWVSRRWAELFDRIFDQELIYRLSYVGALMAFIAAWLAFPEAWTAVAWCALAAGLAWAGRRFNIGALFYQANVLSAAAIGRVLLINLDETASFGRFSLRTITVGLVAALLYLTAHWSWEIGKPAQPSMWRRIANAAYTWTATVLLGLLVWYELHEKHYAAIAVVWAVGGLLLAWLGRKLTKSDLTYQANAVALAALVRVAFVNYEVNELFHQVSVRLITVSLVAVILYVSSKWSWVEKANETRFVGDVYVWAGSFLLSLLAWYELYPVSVAVAWMVGGLILLELGLARNSLSFRYQAYVALLSAFARIFIVNLNAAGDGISPRVYTVVPIALALFYAYWRLLESQPLMSATEKGLHTSGACCWMGTISVVALLRFELLPDWVAAGWAALALLLVISACFTRRIFLGQALMLSFAILFRTVLHNFYQRSYFPPIDIWQSRWVLVGSTVVLLFLALPFLFRLRAPKISVRWFGVFDRHPEQVFFFIAVGLLSTMLAMEMRFGMVTLAWGLEALVIFVIALLAGERSFRLTGLGLLMLCVAKILVKDIWRLQVSDRYLTLVGLGVVLTLVSFLYIRYQAKIAKYL